MIDVAAAFDLSIAVLGEPNPAQAFADFKLLYGLYEAGPIDVAAMKKNGTWKPAVAALARTAALAEKFENDPNHGPALDALVVSLQAKD